MDLTVLQSRFERRHPRSKSFYEKALLSTPGGVHGNLRHYPPFPLTFEKAQGAYLTDADGHVYVDYFLSYGALILGHGDPAVRMAVQEVWEQQGTSSFGAPHPLELEMVDTLKSLLPSLESVRFTNSGLEATLLSVRLALAYTRRTHLAKFEGHYHGSHDHVLISIHPAEAPHEARRPAPKAASFGLPDYFTDHTIVLPYHDWDACEDILNQHKTEIGAVIMEPMMAGFVPADPGMVKRLREWTSQHGVVLIFDEVKTGFRVSLGGAQEYYGVKPDLTTLGKVVGGGFPIGVVGGRRDILDLCSPLRSGQPLFHSGTFNGNPVSLAAGLATLRQLRQPGFFDNMVKSAMKLRDAIESLSQAYNAGWSTLGVGTIFNLVDTATDPQGTAKTARRLALDYLLMEQGVFSKPLNRFSMASVHGPQEIDQTISAFERAFAELTGRHLRS
jgi:glutamate-1-semialdehyde 2,1-aminomutase